MARARNKGNRAYVPPKKKNVAVAVVQPVKEKVPANKNHKKSQKKKPMVVHPENKDTKVADECKYCDYKVYGDNDEFRKHTDACKREYERKEAAKAAAAREAQERRREAAERERRKKEKKNKKKGRKARANAK